MITLCIIELILILILTLCLVNRKTGIHASERPVKDCRHDLEHLRAMRKINLTEPMNEQVRPKVMSEIAGQEDGIAALRAALCGPHPQHVLIYGPPGVGKTCAARLVLEEAKRDSLSPFSDTAPFVEIDATCLRVDERSFADPLIGSVHDPIYQGAGALGVSGIPQPKPGAVTRAHGGVLFLDEIGELPPLEMNKLLKVLEDRRVMFESTYYDPEDSKIPQYIHEVFQHGLPADFRLIGATTRSPQELPPALRSRCVEIYFDALSADCLARIAEQAAARCHVAIEQGIGRQISRFATSGREAVSMLQLAAGHAQAERRECVTAKDIAWVAAIGRYEPQPVAMSCASRAGISHALGVYGPGSGMVMTIEALVRPSQGCGSLAITGIAEKEISGRAEHHLERTSTAWASVQNARVVLGLEQADIRVHLPGGMPVDGPSAGLAIVAALMSANTGKPLPAWTALTGEISLHGDVLPVGGVGTKLRVAKDAGMRQVLIPRANRGAIPADLDMEVICVDSIDEALSYLGFQQKPVPEVPVSAAQLALP